MISVAVKKLFRQPPDFSLILVFQAEKITFGKSSSKLHFRIDIFGFNKMDQLKIR